MIYAPNLFGTAVLKFLAETMVFLIGAFAIVGFTLKWYTGEKIDFPILWCAIMGVISGIGDILDWAFKPKGS